MSPRAFVSGIRRSCLRGLVILGTAWILLGYAAVPELSQQTSLSSAVFDADGNLLRLTTASDERYRLWVPFRDMPESLVQATLTQEDRWFYFHSGINPVSLLRAVTQTYIFRSRRIGASTLSMQLARLRLGLDTSAVRGKLLQIYYALLLERHYTKDELLEAYLNLAPYGGNIEGVGAASLVYFRKPVTKLHPLESITLSVIPQNPKDRNPEVSSNIPKLLQARDRLFNLSNPDVRSQEVQAALLQARVDYGTRRELPFLAPHFVDVVLKQTPGAGKVSTTLNLELQDVIERGVERFREKNQKLGVENASVMLLDASNMEVKAYLGSVNYFNTAIDGQVNGLRGRRSPGSTLKPFIYGLALDQGVIHPQSTLKDTALRLTEYNPENFERDFLGPIPAAEALIRSRNVPAIHLANQLRRPTLYDFLESAEIERLREEEHYGLALALGGAEVSMEELIRLYAMLFNAGLYRPLNFIQQVEDKQVRVERLLSKEAARLVLEMLAENPRPHESFNTSRKNHQRIPWKTGTSYGFRDAWAVGLIGRTVLGVWVGNFDGLANPNFIGREMAGPLFFSITDSLLQKGLVEHGGRESAVGLNLKKLSVCAVSGALPGPHCPHTKQTWFIPGVSPISSCEVHREVAIDSASGLRACSINANSTHREVFEFWPSDIRTLFRQAGVRRREAPAFLPECENRSIRGRKPVITSPQAKLNYVLQGTSSIQVPLTAVSDGDSQGMFWFVDDAFVGKTAPGETLFWNARPGVFYIRAVDSEGRANATGLTVLQAANSRG